MLELQIEELEQNAIKGLREKLNQLLEEITKIKKYNEMKRQEAIKEKMQRLEKLRNYSLMGEKFQKCTFEKEEEEEEEN